ncbi:hypothetical protein L1987_35506 [Smallanthus sonchifolius]|uniref:Uncharacterized protein n=1 Tax=Smallanthus sonchifolius TaxID=185202 RepID=A0ACB9HXI6_9ASTR|nr:hypothetical protein L1987_35506 [Smallanthus sonchifolius]
MGHLVSMVELAKLIHIHNPSLSVIIFITPAPFDTSSTENYINTVSATTPSIKFHRLPTVSLPPDFSTDFIDLAFGIPELYNPIVHNTLVTISQKSSIKAVILDFFSNASFRVSKGLNFPTYYFYTSGASGLCEFLYLTTIHNTTSKNIGELNIYFDIPGLPPIHASDMPPVMFDRETNMYKSFIDTSSNMARSSGLIANSFAGFEERAVEALRNAKIFVVVRDPPPDNIENKSVGEPAEGSFSNIEQQNGKKKDNENESDSGAKDLGLDDILPEGFLARTADKGLVVKNWAPQPAILGHDSVGGFVSHCGWNSTLEAVVAGVPMVAWPLYAEQRMNTVFLVEEMKVAVAVMSADGFVTAEAVEEKVRELMEGEEGRGARERVLEMSRRAKAAVEDGGSSLVDFFKLTKSWTQV